MSFENRSNQSVERKKMVVESVPLEPGLQLVTETLRPLFLKLSFAVGGLFGVYVILLAMRVMYERRQLKLLAAIRYDLDQLNQHFGVTYSKLRPTLWKRLCTFLGIKTSEIESREIEIQKPKKR